VSQENFMGRIDIERSSEEAVIEPYIVLAQTDYESQDCIQTIRIPVSVLPKLQHLMQEHLLGCES